MWKHQNTFSIGGLQEVGFANSQDLLLVLSSQGEGIFDCLNGEKIARRNNEYDWWKRYDKNKNTISGFAMLENSEIKISGITLGDLLPKSTSDFWELQSEKIFLLSASEKVFLSYRGYRTNNIGEEGPCELKAFGFSPTEKSLIFATSCELIIYSRK